MTNPTLTDDEIAAPRRDHERQTPIHRCPTCMDFTRLLDAHAALRARFAALAREAHEWIRQQEARG